MCVKALRVCQWLLPIVLIFSVSDRGEGESSQLQDTLRCRLFSFVEQGVGSEEGGAWYGVWPGPSVTWADRYWTDPPPGTYGKATRFDLVLWDENDDPWNAVNGVGEDNVDVNGNVSPPSNNEIPAPGDDGVFTDDVGWSTPSSDDYIATIANPDITPVGDWKQYFYIWTGIDPFYLYQYDHNTAYVNQLADRAEVYLDQDGNPE